MALSNKQIGVLSWVLVGSGLALLCLGYFARRSGVELLGLGLAAAGAADAVAGVALLWWRSRRPD
ncbi:MAG: hypothetical protein JNL30_12480 [Rubrivivax sp.]|nr:hypothetical protein [Rubrivivax sp.]